MGELYDTDHPELGSLAIRVYPPVASAGVASKGSTTQAKQVDPRKSQHASVVTTKGSTTTITSGSFSSEPVEFNRFLGYEYDEEYLTPCDGWSFSLSADEVTDTDRKALRPAARVEFVIDDNVQSIGYIDDIQVHGSRQSGSIITIKGRDWMSPMVDGHVDPQLQFTEGMDLEQLLTAVLKPFGVTAFDISNEANRAKITGSIYGTPTTKKGKTLKSYKLHLLKPYQREGAFAFASRVSQRQGLWLRPASDGKTIIVAAPDFDQPARYAIRLKTDGTQNNNVTDWDVNVSRADQAAIIFASGSGGGGEFANATLRGAIINPLVALADPNVVAGLLAAYPGLVGATPPVPAILSGIASLMFDPFARPLYLYDRESHDAAELRTYLQRELSLIMRKSLTLKYTIEGHRLGGQPIAVDTMIDVDDDISGIHSPQWVLGRHFSKTHDGTKTTIECIRPGSLQLGPG
jgi:prophage tail gpP-like protein